MTTKDKDMSEQSNERELCSQWYKENELRFYQGHFSDYEIIESTWKAARAPLLVRIAELEAQVAEETKRLDYVLDNYGYMESSKTDAGGIALQLMTQDEDENYIALSGETKFFTTKRAAIDAAIRGNK